MEVMPLFSFTKDTNLKTGQIGSTSPAGSTEEAVIKALLKDIHAKQPGIFHAWIPELKGVSEETTTGVPPPLPDAA
jgi:adenosylhomocysteinase